MKKSQRDRATAPKRTSPGNKRPPTSTAADSPTEVAYSIAATTMDDHSNNLTRFSSGDIIAHNELDDASFSPILVATIELPFRFDGVDSFLVFCKRAAVAACAALPNSPVFANTAGFARSNS